MEFPYTFLKLFRRESSFSVPDNDRVDVTELCWPNGLIA